MTKYLALLVLAAACSDASGPQGPDFLVRNDAGESARFVVTIPAGDTIFDQVLAPGTLVCENIGILASAIGTAYLSADTLTSSPFYTTSDYAEQFLVKSGPELLHTRVARVCQGQH